MKSAPGTRPIHRVLVVAKIGAPEGKSIAGNLVAWLERRQVEIRFDAETASALGRDDGLSREDPPRDVDLVIVAGGCGSHGDD